MPHLSFIEFTVLNSLAIALNMALASVLAFVLTEDITKYRDTHPVAAFVIVLLVALLPALFVYIVMTV